MVLLSSGLARPFNLNGMIREIRPEPSQEELAAIEDALVRLVEPSVDPRGAWWRAGVEEGFSEGEERA
jgi:hypothetical protein